MYHIRWKFVTFFAIILARFALQHGSSSYCLSREDLAMPSCLCGEQVADRSWARHKRECHMYAGAFSTPAKQVRGGSDMPSSGSEGSNYITPLSVTAFKGENQDPEARAAKKARLEASPNAAEVQRWHSPGSAGPLLERTVNAYLERTTNCSKPPPVAAKVVPKKNAKKGRANAQPTVDVDVEENLRTLLQFPQLQEMENKQQIDVIGDFKRLNPDFEPETSLEDTFLNHVDQIHRFCIQYRLNHASFHLSVAILHRVYAVMPLPQTAKEVRLVLCCIVLIASKMEEQEIKLQSYHIEKATRYCISKVCTMERAVTAACGFRLSIITPVALMETAFVAARLSVEEQQWASFLSDLCMYFPMETLFKHRPSVVAAGCIAASRQIVAILKLKPAPAVAAATGAGNRKKAASNNSKKVKVTRKKAAIIEPDVPAKVPEVDSLWTPTLQELTSYSAQDLEAFVSEILKLVLGSLDEVPTLWRRYSSIANGRLPAKARLLPEREAIIKTLTAKSTTV